MFAGRKQAVASSIRTRAREASIPWARKSEEINRSTTKRMFQKFLRRVSLSLKNLM
jgi:hypothetical protein